MLGDTTSWPAEGKRPLACALVDEAKAIANAERAMPTRANLTRETLLHANADDELLHVRNRFRVNVKVL